MHPKEKVRKVEAAPMGMCESVEDNPYTPKTESELFEKIDHSIGQADSGILLDAEEAIDEVIKELAL